MHLKVKKYKHKKKNESNKRTFRICIENEMEMGRTLSQIHCQSGNGQSNQENGEAPKGRET